MPVHTAARKTRPRVGVRAQSLSAGPEHWVRAFAAMTAVHVEQASQSKPVMH